MGDNIYTQATIKMQRRHGLYNDDKAQHEVIVISASNGKRWLRPFI